jgi:anti-sigma factor (TIGR02949 family)
VAAKLDSASHVVARTLVRVEIHSVGAASCSDCEERLQPFLDRVLGPAEVIATEQHLRRCSWCARRYRFEKDLRRYVRAAATEPMPQTLKRKLRALMTSLGG